jgi:protein gp37
MATKIQWCDRTWNPVVGCQKASIGCDNCYAERMARRLHAIGIDGYHVAVGPKGWTGLCSLVPRRLDLPMEWKPSRIFVNSMGDLFHHNARPELVDPVFSRMVACQSLGIKHDFLILTKRPVCAEEYFSMRPEYRDVRWRNLWMGVTIERSECIYRGHTLQGLPGNIKFVSCEPLLGPLDLSTIIKKIDWVICGCETGPGARPMDPNWARLLRDQCQRAGVPFFLKGLTGVKPKKGELPELDGKTWGEFPKCTRLTK